MMKEVIRGLRPSYNDKLNALQTPVGEA